MKTNKDILHLIYIPVTGVGVGNGVTQGYRGDEWFAYRIQLFANWTLPSLLNQTNKNFCIMAIIPARRKDEPISEAVIFIS